MDVSFRRPHVWGGCSNGRQPSESLSSRTLDVLGHHLVFWVWTFWVLDFLGLDFLGSGYGFFGFFEWKEKDSSVLLFRPIHSMGSEPSFLPVASI